MIEVQRRQGEQVVSETRYYISSLPADAWVLLQAVRSYWGVENRLHRVLNLAFREDESRIRTGHAAHNMSILHRLALNQPDLYDDLQCDFAYLDHIGGVVIAHDCRETVERSYGRHERCTKRWGRLAISLPLHHHGRPNGLRDKLDPDHWGIEKGIIYLTERGGEG